MVVFLLVLILNLAEHAWHITDTRDFIHGIQNLNMLEHLSYHCHFRIFSPSAPGPRATAVWKGCCRVKDGEQKYVLCLRHPWHSRTWPWTLPLRSGGSWILPKGTWCWTTIGTWSRFVRTASHCDCSLLWDIILYWKWNSLHSLCFSVQEP